jgi:hypothetical protein
VGEWGRWDLGSYQLLADGYAGLSRVKRVSRSSLCTPINRIDVVWIDVVCGHELYDERKAKGFGDYALL